MRTSIPLWLLAALGALSLTMGGGAFAADPSEWTCETCPFETKSSASVDLGAGVVSNASARFGDFSGLDRKGGFLIAGGDLRYRGGDGLFGSLTAADLGLDSRSLAAELGREGLFRLRLGYAELPHRLSDSALTPFLGSGGAVLTLPAGFPAPSTAQMPLDTTQQALALGFKRSRLDVAASLAGTPEWSYRVDLRHDLRKGNERSAGSFFSTTSQLVAPLDQVTDQFEASVAYRGRRLQATLAYHASLFRNANDALTWQNPFSPAVVGATSGQLALAPDNQFHQVLASAGYTIGPALRASAELGVGRMTQDAPYLAATLNPNLGVPALPARSLRGGVDTLDASLRLSASPAERVHLSASLTRNERNNRTPSAAYPSVSTDMFVGATPRINLPYSFTRDRIKLAADYRGPAGLKLAAGAEHDSLQRTLQASGATREATLWLRGSAQAHKNLALSLKLAHAERRNSGYDAVAAVQPPDNPLLLKYNQADRRRDSAALRADMSFGEGVSAGVSLDLSDDDYQHSLIGLTRSRSAAIGADVAAAVSETTRLRLFAQGERIRSRQAGSQQFGAADWTGRVEDSVDVVGAGVTHSALKGKLELGADITWSRSRSLTSVEIGAPGTPFPAATTVLDGLKAFATYRLNDKLSLLGSYQYERYDTKDWRLDGVAPASVPNLLAFGEQPPRYTVHVVRLALRYRF